MYKRPSSGLHLGFSSGGGGGGGDKRDNHRIKWGKDCTSVFISQE